MRFFGFGKPKKDKVEQITEVLKAMEDFEFLAAADKPLVALKCFEERLRGVNILKIIGHGPIYDDFMETKRQVERQIDGR